MLLDPQNANPNGSMDSNTKMIVSRYHVMKHKSNVIYGNFQEKNVKEK